MSNNMYLIIEVGEPSGSRFEASIVGTIQRWKSVIWNEQFYGFDEFEMEIPFDVDTVSFLEPGQIIMRGDIMYSPQWIQNPNTGEWEYVVIDNHMDRSAMIIRRVEITDGEEGQSVKISGKGVKSLLRQRQPKGTDVVEGLLGDTIRSIINEAQINNYQQRTLGISEYRDADYIAGIDNVSIKSSAEGKTVGDWIVDILTTYDVGWRIRTRYYDQGYIKFEYMLYPGVDKSSAGTDYPVRFTRQNGGLISSQYVYTKEDYANDAMVLGEVWNGVQDKASVTLDDQVKGMKLYETLIDLSSESMAPYVGVQGAGYTQYTDFLRARGMEELKKKAVTVEFSCEIDVLNERMFRLGKDYDLGDRIEVEDEIGTIASARITELITSLDSDGEKTVPTFGPWNVTE